jgi:hypothetical protein
MTYYVYTFGLLVGSYFVYGTIAFGLAAAHKNKYKTAWQRKKNLS